ncbi:hypothetical protein [Lacticaseibacillus zhaodongensis]|uniref:hypothetical protein n=1 Tax=Lacticaseibacillus zhaodongensis TaxID=2668065 RepID=UPI0012D2B5C1|nr:hypothetical protein [Lacticaseibacillus zhaodongensis]
MAKYLITFLPDPDFNGKLESSLRAKAESLSAKKRVQIMPYQVAVETDMDIDEVVKYLQPEADKVRTSVVRFDELRTTDLRSNEIIKFRGL